MRDDRPKSRREWLDIACRRPQRAHRRATTACERSGLSLDDVDRVCGIHMKTSMQEALADALGVPVDGMAPLDDTGHMSGVDPLLGLDRAVRSGDVTDGDLVLLIAAGTGYTWAVQVVRWGPADR